MIGPKKLGAIRRELQNALTATGTDPIRWLEARMGVGVGTAFEDSEVLRSLRRILQSPRTAKKRTRGAGAKK
jgi:hypothetical protein